MGTVNCNKSRDVYYSVKPLFWCSLAMGLHPYGWFKSKLALGYTLLLLVSFLALYNIGQGHGVRVTTHAFTLQTIINRYECYSNNTMVPLFLLASCLNGKHVTEVIDHVARVDTVLSAQIGLQIRHSQTRIFILGYLATTFVLVAMLVSVDPDILVYNRSQLSAVRWLTFYLATGIPCLVECQFVACTLLLYHRFTLLNGHMLVAMQAPLRTAHFTTVQHCHTQLRALCTRVNDTFAVLLVCSIGLLFANSTVSLVVAYEKGKHDNDNDDDDLEMVTSLAWTCYYVVRLCLISSTCDWTTSAGNSMGYLLHITTNKHNERFGRVANGTVALFSKQIIHGKLKFTAFGFFTIDMALFFAIMAAVALYLLILVQMDISSMLTATTVNNTLTTTTTNDLNVTMDW